MLKMKEKRENQKNLSLLHALFFPAAAAALAFPFPPSSSPRRRRRPRCPLPHVVGLPLLQVALDHLQDQNGPVGVQHQ